jgi:cytochrome b
MTPPLTPPLPAAPNPDTPQSGAKTARTPPVFGVTLRLLHAAFALAILGLMASSQIADFFEHTSREDQIWALHIYAGYALAGVLGLRLLWGVAGPASARLRDFWHPAAWRRALQTRRRPARNEHGHDPLASLAYIAMYLVAGGMVLSGLVLAADEFQRGPLAGMTLAHALVEVLKEIHELGFNALLALVGLHLAALLWHQWHGERVAQSMFTGRHAPHDDA